MEIYVRSLAITDVRAIKSAYSAGSNRNILILLQILKHLELLSF